MPSLVNSMYFESIRCGDSRHFSVDFFVSFIKLPATGGILIVQEAIGRTSFKNSSHLQTLLIFFSENLITAERLA